jgi:putative transposase
VGIDEAIALGETPNTLHVRLPDAVLLGGHRLSCVERSGCKPSSITTGSTLASQRRPQASVAARVLGMPEQTRSNWVRLAEKGELQGPSERPVSAEQMELARLRAKLARVKMERDILKKCVSVLCKGIAVKYAWIAKTKAARPVTLTCDVLGMSTGGYFEHQRRRRTSQPSQPGGGRLSNEALLAHIRAIYAEVKGEYGWPRVC